MKKNHPPAKRQWRSARRMFAALCLIICALIAGCDTPYEKDTRYYFDSFDTVISITGYFRDQSVFDETVERAHQRFLALHKLFDPYNEYEGVNNLKTLNMYAHQSPIEVEPELFELLVYAKRMQAVYPDTLNIALGSVIELWHGQREIACEHPEQAALPNQDALLEAARHANIDSLILDEANRTVFYADPELNLNLGALAKGYAAELVAQELLESEMPSFLINAGGNVRAGQAPRDGREAWRVAVENPSQDQSESIAVLSVTDQSVVTSGDYQRYYELDGVRYHHLIDPKTLYPADTVHSVTIITQSSAEADFFSTVAFIMPYEQARAMIEAAPGIEAIWAWRDGRVEMSGGVEGMLING